MERQLLLNGMSWNAKLYLPQPGFPSGKLLCNRKWTGYGSFFFVLRKQRVIVHSNLRLWRLVKADKAIWRPFHPLLTAFCFLSITLSSVTRGCSDPARSLKSGVCYTQKNRRRGMKTERKKSFLQVVISRSISLVFFTVTWTTATPKTLFFLSKLFFYRPLFCDLDWKAINRRQSTGK